MAIMVGLTHETIDVGALLAASERDGAVATFLGVVRGASAGGDPVSALEYEAYEEMALPEMEAIAAEAAGRWEVSAVRVIHRLGRLAVGEVSVAIVVSAPHRGPAFAACRFVIDSLKQRVPIWKKELTAGGGLWIEDHAPRARRA
jgi:molybdopterin synthase catalytic subunit